MHTSRHRRSRLSSLQALSPPPIWHDSYLVDEDCQEHADRGERFTGQAPDSHGDSRMSRDRGKGEHGPVIFIGSAEEVTGAEREQQRSDGHVGVSGSSRRA